MGRVKMSLESTIRMVTERKVIKEDGHTDVASAKRQCKTAMEDAQAIIGVLNGMNNEDTLPTWWTNKLAIAANSMNKLNDYLANPTEQKEEVELDEKSQYGSDIKGEISQLQKMLKGLERGKKTPGRGFAKMKIKELIADLEQRQAQDDAVIKLRGEEVELDESKMKDLAMKIADVYTKMKKDKQMKPFADKFRADVKTSMNIKKSLEKVLPDYVGGGNITKLMAEEVEMEDLDNLIEEALNEEVKYPHMMYDPETGEGVEAKTPEDHDKLAKKGYTHEKPELDEAPKMKYALVGKDMKIYSMGSDERDLKLDRRSLEKRFKDVAPLKMARLKTAQKIGDTVDKSQLKEETVNEHTHYKMEPFGVSRSLVDSVKAVLAGKPSRENIPEEILDDDVADFIGAASKAAQAGKKTFKFGDKEYPVTIKKDTAKKVASKMDEEKPAKKEEKEDKNKGKKEPVQIDPEIKEETK